MRTPDLLHYGPIILILSLLAGCQKKATPLSGGGFGGNALPIPVLPEEDNDPGPTDSGTTTGSSSAGSTTGSTSGSATGGGTGAGSGCNGVWDTPCLGGYGDDPTPITLKVRVVLLGSAPGTNVETLANAIVNNSNQAFNYNGHQLMQLELDSTQTLPAPGANNILNTSFVAQNYGWDGGFVYVIYSGLANFGIGGYTPGIFRDVFDLEGFTVLDLNYALGANVPVHELFHYLGSPHTTNINGSTPGVFLEGRNPYTSFLNFTSGTGPSSLVNRDFDVFVNPGTSPSQYNNQGIVNCGADLCDLGTMMFYSVQAGNPFFKEDGITGFDYMYAEILDNYYQVYIDQ